MNEDQIMRPLDANNVLEGLHQYAECTVCPEGAARFTAWSQRESAAMTALEAHYVERHGFKYAGPTRVVCTENSQIVPTPEVIT